MSCDQEMCPFWDGDGCPCRVLDISDEERAQQRRAMGIEPLNDDVFADTTLVDGNFFVPVPKADREEL